MTLIAPLTFPDPADLECENLYEHQYQRHGFNSWWTVEASKEDGIWAPFHAFASKWFSVASVAELPKFRVFYNSDYERVDFVYQGTEHFTLTFAFEYGVPYTDAKIFEY